MHRMFSTDHRGVCIAGDDTQAVRSHVGTCHYQVISGF